MLAIIYTCIMCIPAVIVGRLAILATLNPTDAQLTEEDN